MKSVMKNKTNSLKMQGDTSGQFVFSCCVLFFLFISISSFISNHYKLGRNLHLSQSSTGSLALSTVFDESVTPPHLTPFFFKAIPLNSCDKKLLLTVSGIGPSLADSILKTRNQIGNFSDMKDLLLVPGIGSSRMIKFSKSLDFEIKSLGE